MTEKNNSSSIEEKYQEITANLRKTKRISPFLAIAFYRIMYRGNFILPNCERTWY